MGVGLCYREGRVDYVGVKCTGSSHILSASVRTSPIRVVGAVGGHIFGIGGRR
jgi:hypothetical protein